MFKLLCFSPFLKHFVPLRMKVVQLASVIGLSMEQFKYFILFLMRGQQQLDHSRVTESPCSVSAASAQHTGRSRLNTSRLETASFPSHEPLAWTSGMQGHGYAETSAAPALLLLSLSRGRSRCYCNWSQLFSIWVGFNIQKYLYFVYALFTAP